MHVLITSDTLNGNWIYTRELVSGLITRGLRVTLVSFGEIPLPEQTAWMERLHGLVYHPTAFRLDWMQEGQQDFDDASAYLCSLVKRQCTGANPKPARGCAGTSRSLREGWQRPPRWLRPANGC